MAINPNDAYPTRTTTPDADYPYGGAQNVSAPSDGTGTPWIANLINDIFGFQQALLKAGGDIVPSGDADTAVVSQYLDALNEIIKINGDLLGYLKADGSVPMTGDLGVKVGPAESNQFAISIINDSGFPTGDILRYQDGAGTYLENKGGALIRLDSAGAVLTDGSGEQTAFTVPRSQGGLWVHNSYTVSSGERVLTTSDLTGVGDGDFKADGSVPMTGTLQSTQGNDDVFAKWGSLSFEQNSGGESVLARKPSTTYQSWLKLTGTTATMRSGASSQHSVFTLREDYTECNNNIRAGGSALNALLPTQNNDLIRKDYFDQNSGSGDFKADGSVAMTGDFNAGSNALTNLKIGQFGPPGTDLSLYFDGDNDTGITSTGANTIQVLAGIDNFSSAPIMSLDANTGVANIGVGSYYVRIDQNTNQNIAFRAGGSERMFLNETNLDITGLPLKNLAPPVDATDGANKAYVDASNPDGYEAYDVAQGTVVPVDASFSRSTQYVHFSTDFTFSTGGSGLSEGQYFRVFVRDTQTVNFLNATTGVSFYPDTSTLTTLTQIEGKSAEYLVVYAGSDNWFVINEAVQKLPPYQSHLPLSQHYQRQQSNGIVQFDLTTLTQSTWVTVGPTGSGADFIWPGMDDVPLDATVLECTSNMTVGVTVDSAFINLDASSVTNQSGLQTKKAQIRSGAIVSSIVDLSHWTVQLSGLNTFNIRLTYNTPDIALQSCLLTYTGFFTS